jgi:hypothetical protein
LLRHECGDIRVHTSLSVQEDIAPPLLEGSLKFLE